MGENKLRSNPSQVDGWTLTVRRSTLQLDAEEVKVLFNMRGTLNWWSLCTEYVSGWHGKSGLRCCTAEGADRGVAGFKAGVSFIHEFFDISQVPPDALHVLHLGITSQVIRG